MKKINNRGFTFVGVLLVILTLTLLTGVGYYIYQNQTAETENTPIEDENTTEKDNSPKTEDPSISINDCADFTGNNNSSAFLDEWQARLSNNFSVYATIQHCNLSDGRSLVSFKKSENKLPPALALYNNQNKLVKNTEFDCKALGGDGPALYIKELNEDTITVYCRDGHLGESVKQTFEVNINTFEKRLVDEESTG